MHSKRSVDNSPSLVIPFNSIWQSRLEISSGGGVYLTTPHLFPFGDFRDCFVA